LATLVPLLVRISSFSFTFSVAHLSLSLLGSRIREYVAQCTFDQFHRHSNAIIEEAVFHRNPETGKINPTLLLEANNMIVSNVDVHSIEPADPSVLASLTKSVQMGMIHIYIYIFSLQIQAL